MDAIDQLRQDALEGRVKPDRLVDLIVAQQQQLQAKDQQLQAKDQQLQAAHQRIAELEQQVGGAGTAKVDEPFSMRAEEKRQEKRGKVRRKRSEKGRRAGRLKTRDKLALAQRTEACYPEGVAREACHLSHTRPVWRLENGRAVLIAYAIYRGPNDQYGQVPGVLGRSEFGLEIVTEIAHLVYVVGLSFDKVCLMLKFFQELSLRKSQVDALLNQLSRHWEREFDVLCTLLANSAVVHADETRWSLNSVWAFLSEKARVLFFGVHKDLATLKEILDPATFEGLVISDDAAVYANFTASQKCWAHLLRKAIKLTLQDANNTEYRTFADGLLEIYRQACRVQRDQRLGDAGRARKVEGLESDLVSLCLEKWLADSPPCTGHANDYRLLVNELMRLYWDGELFVFVTTPPVEQLDGTLEPVAGTNNEAERTLRGAATARKTGRTSKTPAGARRQTILGSVLESLRLHLQPYTLSSVLAEVQRWQACGRSCFTELLLELGLVVPQVPVLDRVIPRPSG